MGSLRPMLAAFRKPLKVRLFSASQTDAKTGFSKGKSALVARGHRKSLKAAICQGGAMQAHR